MHQMFIVICGSSNVQTSIFCLKVCHGAKQYTPNKYENDMQALKVERDSALEKMREMKDHERWLKSVVDSRNRERDETIRAMRPNDVFKIVFPLFCKVFSAQHGSVLCNDGAI